MRRTLLAALALAFPAPMAAQDGFSLDKFRSSMRLPVLSTEAREAGVPDEQVKRTVWDIRRSGVPADDASRIFDEEVRFVREGGSKDNFGAFVRSQVERGLRGRELAESIHREQARRGQGKPAAAGGNKPDKATGKPAEGGKPDEGGKPPEAGRPDQPDQAGGRGQPPAQDQSREAAAGRGRKK